MVAQVQYLKKTVPFKTPCSKYQVLSIYMPPIHEYYHFYSKFDCKKSTILAKSLNAWSDFVNKRQCLLSRPRSNYKKAGRDHKRRSLPWTKLKINTTPAGVGPAYGTGLIADVALLHSTLDAPDQPDSSRGEPESDTDGCFGSKNHLTVLFRAKKNLSKIFLMVYNVEC